MPEGRLIVEGRGNWAYTYWLKEHGAVRIGRGPGNDLQLSDSAVSTTHAEVAHDGERYVLRDLRSSNGTFVNGKKVASHPLRDGDQIRMGQCKMAYLEWSPKMAAEPPSEQTRAEASFGTESTRLDTVFERMGKLNQSLVEKQSAGGAALVTKEIKKFSQELTQAQKELRRAQEEMETLTLQNSLHRMLQSDAPENKRLGAALTFIANQLRAENGFVMLIDPKTKKWVVRSRFGGISDWSPGEGARPVSLTVVEQAVKSGEAFFSDSLVTDARVSEAMSIMRLEIQGAMCLPLKTGDEVIGVMYLDRRINPGPFPEKARRQAEAFGGVLSNYLVNR